MFINFFYNFKYCFKWIRLLVSCFLFFLGFKLRNFVFLEVNFKDLGVKRDFVVFKNFGFKFENLLYSWLVKVFFGKGRKIILGFV